MSYSLAPLLGSAAVIAVIHTVIGVDHYLPFIALGKAEGWSLKKTLFWTLVCGLGHVLSSVLLAVGAGALGWAAGNVNAIEQVRGDVAAYLLIALGSIYLVVDLLFGGKRHVHPHVHRDGTLHTHPHAHRDGTAHAHDDVRHAVTHQKTLWAMFIIFVLGPCEPLVALIMGPTLNHDIGGALLVVGLFGAITIAAMLGMVTLGYVGLRLLRVDALTRWSHSLAGAAIAISGVLILLGL